MKTRQEQILDGKEEVMKLTLVAVVLAVALFGCAQYKPVPVTVENVRMTFELVPEKPPTQGHAVAGALVGGLITKKAYGAIIGAAVGDSSRQEAIPAHGHLAACGFTAVTADGKKAVFCLTERESMKECSLLREGDQISIYWKTDGNWSGFEWHRKESELQ